MAAPMSIGDRSKRAANRRTSKLMAATECPAGHPYIDGSWRESRTPSGRPRRVCLDCGRRDAELKSARLRDLVNDRPDPAILAVIEAVIAALNAGQPFEQIAVAVAETRQAWAGPATPDLARPVYQIPCPLCGAAPGSPCAVATTSLWRPVGSSVQHAHLLRVQAFHDR